MTTRPAAPERTPAEARSGLDPWVRAELPILPAPRGLGWVGAVGPGVIVLGLSIGSGEFLLGPATFVRHGLTLLWVTLVAVLLQTIFNTEVMRYTVATGEPVFTGFMRTRPSATAWAWVYAALYFLQTGWPAWAANAAGAIFFLFARRLAGPADATAVYNIGVATFLMCVAVLLVGRRIERTLEVLNWVLIVCILGSFLVLAALFVPPRTSNPRHADFQFLAARNTRPAPTIRMLSLQHLRDSVLSPLVHIGLAFGHRLDTGGSVPQAPPVSQLTGWRGRSPQLRSAQARISTT